MLVYYCQKCQRQSHSNICESCGKSLPGTASRYVWSDYRSPIQDMVRVGALLRLLLMSLSILVLAMFSMELIAADAQIVRFMTDSGILSAVVQVFFFALLAALLVLALQGKENVQYILDPKGALKRTWITPNRLTCWSRGLRYDKRAIQYNAQGEPFLMAHEEYLVWQDAARYSLRPQAGRIKLFRPYAFLFMSMHVPREAYDGAAAMVAAKIKPKR